MATSSEAVLGRIQQRVDELRSDRRLIGISLLLLLFFISGLPMLVTILASFTAEGAVIFAREFTLANWELTLRENQGVIYNTLVFALGSAALTTTLAVFIGWTIARTNAPFGRLFYFTVFGMLFLPPIVWESVWIQLLGRAGLYTQLLPFSFNIYSIHGMVLVQAFHMLPLGLIILMPMFTNVNSALEEASRMNGGGVLRTTWSITMPLLRPGILASFLLVLVVSLGSLRVPLMIGLPKGIYVLSNSIYRAIIEAPVQYGIAMVDGTILILLSIPLFFLYRKSMGDRSRYQTVSGRAFNQASIELSRPWRYLLSTVVGVLLLLIAVVPVVQMIYTSLIPYPISITKMFSESHPGFNLSAYSTILGDVATRSALTQSFVAAIVATALLVFLATTISWVVEKSDTPFRRSIDYLSFLPLAITSVSLAVGLIVIYLELVPIAVYGTLAIFVIAYVTRYLPGTVRAVAPSVTQVDNSLLESAEISGAGKLTRIRTILGPLVISSLHAIGAMRFALLFKELPLTLMLQTPDTKLLGAYLYQLSVHAEPSLNAALGVVITGFLLVTTLAIHQIGSGSAIGRTRL